MKTAKRWLVEIECDRLRHKDTEWAELGSEIAEEFIRRRKEERAWNMLVGILWLVAGAAVAGLVQIVMN